MIATEGLAQVNTLATHTALTAWNFGSDFLVVIVLTLLFVLFARSAGRGPFVALILSSYCAYALYSVFPYLSYLPTTPVLTALLAHIGLYLALCILFYIVLRRVIVSDFLYIGIFGLILLSFFSAGFLLALGYHVFGVPGVFHFTLALDTLFAIKEYFFWWFIAPIIGLFFFAR
jgi:hypothetical protein